MAGVVVDNTASSNVIWKTQYTSVWVKPYWGVDWQYVPYMYPINSSEYAAPADSTATFEWDYGKFLLLWTGGSGTLYPSNIEQWFIKTVVHTVYGNYISWIGVVVGETIKEEGIYTDGTPRGQQIIECRGLEHLLERRNILGTYVGDEIDGVEYWTYLSKTRGFNKPSSRREAIKGNRSSFVNSTAGTYLFGEGNEKWSNLDICNYVLSAFQPWVPIGGLRGEISYVPLFRMAGQTQALDFIFDVHAFHGTTVRDALNKLIDRRRGLGWKIVTDGEGPIYINVFSLSEQPIYGNGVYVPRNPRQVVVGLNDDPFIKGTLRLSNMNQVDEIVVQSSEPMKTMATLSFVLGSLEPAWDPNLDADRLSGVLQENIGILATEILANFNSIDVDSNGLIDFVELATYAEDNPSGFDFIPSFKVSTAMYYLDTDADTTISVEDLNYLIPPDLSYQLATDEQRATDKYAAVFSSFRVPKSWNWSGWVPQVRENGTLNFAATSGYWNNDGKLLRYLPIMEPGYSEGVEREYLEPFAVIQKKNRNREILLALANDGNAPYSYAEAQVVVEDLTEAEFNQFDTIGDPFDVSWAEILAGLADNPETYIQLDRAQQIEIEGTGERYPSCSLRMGDTGLKISVRSEANHVFARNHFDGAVSEIETQWDYETLLATVFVETDVALRVKIPVYNSIYADTDENGNEITVRQRTPQGRQIFIEVPGKEVWIAAPFTITGLDGELLEYFRDGAGGVIRNDMDDIRGIAMAAFVWYAQQRASASFEIANQLNFFGVGDLVLATQSGLFIERIGTCVTGIERDYQNSQHSVTTGYAELDPVELGGMSLR